MKWYEVVYGKMRNNMVVQVAKMLINFVQLIYIFKYLLFKLDM